MKIKTEQRMMLEHDNLKQNKLLTRYQSFYNEILKIFIVLTLAIVSATVMRVKLISLHFSPVNMKCKAKGVLCSI